MILLITYAFTLVYTHTLLTTKIIAVFLYLLISAILIFFIIEPCYKHHLRHLHHRHSRSPLAHV
jgi:capsular polysaccharide biosynthesis protein